MDVLAIFLCVRESGNNLGILHYAVVGTCTVNLYQILINDTSCTDIQVSYFGVTHLSVGQTNVLTASLQFRVRIVCQQRIPVRSGSVKDYIVFTLIADTPTIKNH